MHTSAKRTWQKPWLHRKTSEHKEGNCETVFLSTDVEPFTRLSSKCICSLVIWPILKETFGFKVWEKKLEEENIEERDWIKPQQIPSGKKNNLPKMSNRFHDVQCEQLLLLDRTFQQNKHITYWGPSTAPGQLTIHLLDTHPWHPDYTHLFSDLNR